MSEKAVAVEGVSPQWQLGIVRGRKQSNISVSLPEEAHTAFCERPASLEPPRAQWVWVEASGRSPHDGLMATGHGPKVATTGTGGIMHPSCFTGQFLAWQQELDTTLRRSQANWVALICRWMRRATLRETWKRAGHACSTMSNTDLFVGKCPIARVWLWRKASWLLMGISSAGNGGHVWPQTSCCSQPPFAPVPGGTPEGGWCSISGCAALHGLPRACAGGGN